MFKYLLMASVLCIACDVYAGGDAKNMSDHELRVKAAWNCKSAKGWCAESQSVVYNKCKCAKRMCDAAQRAREAAERGYDDGADCANGSSYCGVAKSEECTTALAGPRPASTSPSGDNPETGDVEPCPKEEGQTCVRGAGGQCRCSGNAKGDDCPTVIGKAKILKRRCEAARNSAEGDHKGVCAAYEIRRQEAERCGAGSI